MSVSMDITNMSLRDWLDQFYAGWQERQDIVTPSPAIRPAERAYFQVRKLVEQSEAQPNDKNEMTQDWAPGICPTCGINTRQPNAGEVEK